MNQRSIDESARFRVGNDPLYLEGVEKSFGKRKALNGIKMNLKRGERLALLGPNGAGKTTLVRAIAGRVRLDAGSISLEPGIELGVVPQEIALYSQLTARENLEVFASLSGVPRGLINDRTHELLDWIGLSDRGDDRVSHFSGGMKRRLNIACSLMHRPSLLLLDEPTVGVDPQSRQRIWEMLDDLQQEEIAILVTTHMLDEAEKVCDRIVILDEGKVVAEGTLEELIRQTIGSGKQITLFFDGKMPPQSFWPEAGMDSNSVLLSIRDITTELPELMNRLKQDQYTVSDIHIKSPSLHAVFIHLTGRDLRDA